MKIYVVSMIACTCFILTGCSSETPETTESSGTKEPLTVKPTVSEPSNPERSFQLGIVPMPQGWSGEEIASAYQLSRQAGEVISLTQKIGWGSDKYLKQYQNDVTLARKQGLEIFISVDVLEDDRKEIANLPKGLKGKGFADKTLRQLYIDEVTEIAKKYRPENIALAVEINGYYISHPEDFPHFVSLYKEAFHSIKAVSPKTKVAVSFLYETMVAETQWDLLSMFGEQLELLCLTTYPEFLYGDSPQDIPEAHYAILKNIEGLPIAFMEIGWSGKNNEKGEQQQAEFITRFFELTEDTNLSLAIWTLLHDWKGGGVFETMGLIDSQGRKKPAWETFKSM